MKPERRQAYKTRFVGFSGIVSKVIRITQWRLAAPPQAAQPQAAQPQAPDNPEHTSFAVNGYSHREGVGLETVASGGLRTTQIQIRTSPQNWVSDSRDGKPSGESGNNVFNFRVPTMIHFVTFDCI